MIPLYDGSRLHSQSVSVTRTVACLTLGVARAVGYVCARGDRSPSPYYWEHVVVVTPAGYATLGYSTCPLNPSQIGSA